jgi:hypothetical protein
MDILPGLFEAIGLYSTSGGLGDHLRGMGIDCHDFSRQSAYHMVFLVMIFADIIIMLNYYYGLLNRYPFNKVVWWLVNVLAGALTIYLIAYLGPHKDLVNSDYCEQLVFHESDCMGFGFTAAIYSVIWSVLLSPLLKWKSIVNKKIPF